MAAEVLEYLKSVEKPRLALDLETYWLVPRPDDVDAVPRPIKQNGIIEGLPRTIQIGLPPEAEDLQYVIDVKKMEEENPETRKMVGELLKPILEFECKNGKHVPIFGQNLQYEFEFMYAVYGIRLRNLRDTMYIRAVLEAGDKTKRRSLGTLYDEYLPPHFFKAYTGMYQHEYENFKKEMQTSNWKAEELTQDQIRYAADDVSKLIFELYDQMLEGHETRSVDAFIAKYEGKNAYGQTILNPIKLEWAVIPIYGGMGLRGVGFNRDYHVNTVIPFLEKAKREQEEIVEKYFVREVKKSNGLRGKARLTWTEKEVININSHQQVLPRLKEIGIDLPNYQEETLLEAQKVHDHEVLDAIISYKKIAGCLSKYAYSIMKHLRSDGRVYPSWHQLGTGTGRGTCTDPNLTTIPIRDEIAGEKAADLCRESFIPPPGYDIVDADFSQMEPRTMAGVCQDEVLMAAYQGENEVDEHALTAKLMFNLDYMPVSGDPLRAAGKEYNLGTKYGMGLAKAIKKISQATKGKINPTMDEMKAMRDSYWGNLVGLKRKKDEMEKKLKKLFMKPNYLINCLKRDEPIAVFFTVSGRPRRWTFKSTVAADKLELYRKHPHLLDWDAPTPEDRQFGNVAKDLLNRIIREAFNHATGQGTAADIFKNALVLVQDRLDAEGFDFATEGIILTVYDEIVLQVKKENTEKAKVILRECMTQAANDIIEDVFFKIDCNAGPSWAQTH